MHGALYTCRRKTGALARVREETIPSIFMNCVQTTCLSSHRHYRGRRATSSNVMHRSKGLPTKK